MERGPPAGRRRRGRSTAATPARPCGCCRVPSPDARSAPRSSATSRSRGGRWSGSPRRCGDGRDGRDDRRPRAGPRRRRRDPCARSSTGCPSRAPRSSGAITLAALAADGRDDDRRARPDPRPHRADARLARRTRGPRRSRDDDRRARGLRGARHRPCRATSRRPPPGSWPARSTPTRRSALEGVGLNPSRLAIVDVLREMGAAITVTPAVADDACPEPVGSTSRSGAAARLRPIRIDGARVADLIDELPLLAVAMAAADGRERAARRGRAAASRSRTGSRSSSRTCVAIGVDAEERPDGWRRAARHGRGTASIRTARRPSDRDGVRVAALTGVAGAVDVDDPGVRDGLVPGLLGRPRCRVRRRPLIDDPATAPPADGRRVPRPAA